MSSPVVFRVFGMVLVTRLNLTVAATASAAGVCVYNDAAVVVSFHVKDNDTGDCTAETNSYPVWKVRCLNVNDLGGFRQGATLVPVVHAVWGKTYEASPITYDSITASQVTYVCKGDVFGFSCSSGDSPITPGDVAKDMGEFTLGFAKGLGHQLGFDGCEQHLADLYNTVVKMVSDFKKGINHKIATVVLDAFKLVAALLKAVGSCVKAVQGLIAKFNDIALSLSGDPLSLIKTIVKEGMHIYHDREDLTNDCKAIVVDWDAGDFHGSGYAVGDIVGDLIGGLELEVNPVQEEIVV